MATAAAAKMLTNRRLHAPLTIGLLALLALAVRAVPEPTVIPVTKFLTRANLELLVLFTLVLLVGSLYRVLGNMANHLVYWTRYLRNPRLAIVATALLLGAMPVKGRTIMVSPVVAEVAKQHRLGVFPAAMVNHLATHTSYLISPLSASLLLVVSTLQLDFFRFVGYLLPGTIVLVAVVVYYAWRINRANPADASPDSMVFGTAAVLTLPVIVLLIALALAELRHLPYAVAGGAFLFAGLTFVVLKPTRRQLAQALRSMDWQLVVTLTLILLLSAYTANLPGLTAWAHGVLSSRLTLPVVVVVGYLTGLIIGSSTAMVAAVFPVLAPVVAGLPNVYQIAAVTYAAQYAGYVASPAHPCCHYVAAYFRKPYLPLWVRIAGVAGGAAVAVIAVAVWRG